MRLYSEEYLAAGIYVYREDLHCRILVNVRATFRGNFYVTNITEC